MQQFFMIVDAKGCYFKTSGGYAKFTGLKTYNKELKTMLAIGGNFCLPQQRNVVVVLSNNNKITFGCVLV
jgi:hypothetical protein